jgi:hypothetical protein
VLDELGLAVLPLLLGRGMQPAPSVGNDAALTLTGHRAPASEVGIRLPALADRPRGDRGGQGSRLELE